MFCDIVSVWLGFVTASNIFSVFACLLVIVSVWLGFVTAPCKKTGNSDTCIGSRFQRYKYRCYQLVFVWLGFVTALCKKTAQKLILRSFFIGYYVFCAIQAIFAAKLAYLVLTIKINTCLVWLLVERKRNCCWKKLIN